jgi:hypothetical protein
MKKSPLAFMLLMAFAFSSQANAQLINAGATVSASATVSTDVDCSNVPVTQGPENLAWQAACNPRLQDRPERQPNPEMEASRAELEEARGNSAELRDTQKVEADARREETKEMSADLREDVRAGEVDREEAKVEMEAQREANVEAGAEARENRVAAQTEVVSKRQAMIDVRVAAVREKDAGLADIMENYYGQIMDNIEAVQAKQTSIINRVKSGSMTVAEAQAEFKAYIAVEKVSVQNLIVDMKAAITVYQEAKKSAASDE